MLVCAQASGESRALDVDLFAAPASLQQITALSGRSTDWRRQRIQLRPAMLLAAGLFPITQSALFLRRHFHTDGRTGFFLRKAFFQASSWAPRILGRIFSAPRSKQIKQPIDRSNGARFIYPISGIVAVAVE